MRGGRGKDCKKNMNITLESISRMAYGPNLSPQHRVALGISGKLYVRTMSKREVSELLSDIQSRCLPPFELRLDGELIKRGGVDLDLRRRSSEQANYVCKECLREVNDLPGDTCGSCRAQRERDDEADMRSEYREDFSDLDGNDGEEG
jgi:hypothetical protein